jgi:LCP family protein required for cell wall assembly
MTSTSPSSTPASSRRGLPKWLKVTIITFLVLANLVVLGLFWAISTGQSFLSGADTDDEVVSALSDPSGDQLIFLVVGSDSREELDDLTNFGSAGGQRGDVIMLVKVDRSTGDATILSIPRDLWVDIPGYGENKINAAYAYGGPSLMVQTIQENLGIPINHYVEVGFAGFMAIVDEVGGIEIDFPNDARDLSSGLSVSAGTQTLDGEQALAYARSRKYQELQNGSWVSVDANDIGRTHRQQEVVGAILHQLKSPSTVTEAGQIASAVSQHLLIDTRLAESSVAALAWDFRGLITGGIESVTLPVDITTIGSASVVVRHEPDATQTIEDFLSGVSASASVDQGPYDVQVLNGNGVSGAAGSVGDRLEAAGFSVLSVGDAETKDYPVTTVLVPAGSPAGEAVIAELGYGQVVNSSIDPAYDAVVIVGADMS